MRTSAVTLLILLAAMAACKKTDNAVLRSDEDATTGAAQGCEVEPATDAAAARTVDQCSQDAGTMDPPDALATPGAWKGRLKEGFNASARPAQPSGAGLNDIVPPNCAALPPKHLEIWRGLVDKLDETTCSATVRNPEGPEGATVPLADFVASVASSLGEAAGAYRVSDHGGAGLTDDQIDDLAILMNSPDLAAERGASLLEQELASTASTIEDDELRPRSAAVNFVSKSSEEDFARADAERKTLKNATEVDIDENGAPVAPQGGGLALADDGKIKGFTLPSGNPQWGVAFEPSFDFGMKGEKLKPERQLKATKQLQLKAIIRGKRDVLAAIVDTKFEGKIPLAKDKFKELSISISLVGYKLYAKTLSADPNVKQPETGLAAIKRDEPGYFSKRVQKELVWPIWGPVKLVGRLKFDADVKLKWEVGAKVTGDVDPGPANVDAKFMIALTGAANLTLQGEVKAIAVAGGAEGTVLLASLTPSVSAGVLATLKPALEDLCLYAKGELNYTFLSGTASIYGEFVNPFTDARKRFLDVRLFSWNGFTDNLTLLDLKAKNCANQAHAGQGAASTLYEASRGCTFDPAGKATVDVAACQAEVASQSGRKTCTETLAKLCRDSFIDSVVANEIQNEVQRRIFRGQIDDMGRVFYFKGREFCSTTLGYPTPTNKSDYCEFLASHFVGERLNSFPVIVDTYCALFRSRSSYYVKICDGLPDALRGIIADRDAAKQRFRGSSL